MIHVIWYYSILGDTFIWNVFDREPSISIPFSAYGLCAFITSTSKLTGIVGADKMRHNFYHPPKLTQNENENHFGDDGMAKKKYHAQIELWWPRYKAAKCKNLARTETLVSSSISIVLILAARARTHTINIHFVFRESFGMPKKNYFYFGFPSL